jgi:RNA polymerase sigma-70 factor, ECF subfamily
MVMESLALKSATTFDKQALVDIYEQHSLELFRYAFRMLGDSDMAEDCVAETFSRFLRVVNENRQQVAEVRPYLYRVAHNWITDHFRRQPLPHLMLDDDMQADPEGNPSHLVAQKLERERLRSALLCLPPDQRQVIELRFLEEWSHEAVAAATGKTAEATRALQHRALAALRRLLLDKEDLQEGKDAET